MNGVNAVFGGRLESQRDNLMSQSYNLDQVAFAAESMKDAQATVSAGRREGGREGGRDEKREGGREAAM